MTLTPTTTFADFLRDARSDANLKQTELAALAGISANSIMKYEAGQRHPTVDSAQRLADALGLTGADRDQMLAYATPEPQTQTISRVLGALDALRQQLAEVEARLAELERRDGSPRRRA